MMKGKISCMKLLVVCFTIACLFVTVSCSNKVNDEAAKAALKALDIAECNNLMSLHSWYHAAMQNDVELEKIWAQRDDVIWAQTGGYWKGIDHIKKNYGQKATEDTTKGGYVWHTITSGVVEIAEDRQTAKGVWYTPGGGGKATNGKLDFGWMWEKYGVDFIRENGVWKVWHMKVYTDWAMPIYESGQGMGGPGSGSGGQQPAAQAQAQVGQQPPAQGQAQGQGTPVNTADKQGTQEITGQGGQAQPQPGQGMPKWDVEYKKPYMGWTSTTSPQLVPRPPEPYKTFSETWSYADDGQ
jgi:hypothetical protein